MWVDFVVEIGGSNTLAQSLKAAGIGTEVAAVGFRGGQGEGGAQGITPQFLCSIRRIQVGSRQQFEQMCRAIEVNGTKPVIDRVFTFEESREALEYLNAQRHVGKVVVEV